MSNCLKSALQTSVPSNTDESCKPLCFSCYGWFIIESPKNKSILRLQQKLNIAICCWWISADEYFFLPLCLDAGGRGALIHISMSQPCWITALLFYSALPLWQCRPHYKAVGDHGRITVTLGSREVLCLYKHIKHINNMATVIFSIRCLSSQTFCSQIFKAFKSALKLSAFLCHGWGLRSRACKCSHGHHCF